MLGLVDVSAFDRLVSAFPGTGTGPWPGREPDAVRLVHECLFLRQLGGGALGGAGTTVSEFSRRPGMPLSVTRCPPLRSAVPAFVELGPVDDAAVPSAGKIVVLQECLGMQLAVVSVKTTTVRRPGVGNGPPAGPITVVKPVGRGLIP